jgi:hypothetical protein
MTIEDDVRTIARQWGHDPALVQAVVNAEGNIVKAVQCSFPKVASRADALEILCRSLCHAMSDYIKGLDREAFVRFFGQRWAPIGVANDPTNLNHNWSSNVRKLWGAAVLLLILHSGIANAQPSPEDIVQRHRESYGERVSPTEAPILLRAIAVDLTQTFGTRYGLLVKQSGNNCGGFACDIICDSNKDHWDVFTDGPDASEHYAGLAAPSWNAKGSIGDRTCQLVDVDKPSPDVDRPPAVDLSKFQALIDTLTGRVDALDAQLASLMHDVQGVRDDLETRSESMVSAIEALAARPTISTCHASAFGIPIHCEVK